jgi:CheY-like chemotaxis protein
VGKRTTTNQKLQYLGFESQKSDDERDCGKHEQGSSDNSSNEKSQTTVGLQKRRVALVDDDLLIRSIFEKILAAHGFEIVASLSDGEEIVRAIDQMDPKPDLILLDERMPRISGVEACRIIHSKYPEISIIFVTADESAKQRAKAVEASAFLSKPVKAKDLISTLNSFSS